MNKDTLNILQKIIQRKAEEISQRKSKISQHALQQKIKDNPPPRGFNLSIQKNLNENKLAIIAEIKKASPSAGIICQHFDPQLFAKSYESAGASCLSVLTDVDFFCGSDQHMQQARAACRLPILRKDFMIDPYQIYESRALGADCILIIVSVLSDTQMQELAGIAKEIGLDVIVEIHTREELERGLMLRTPLIGINNRDLHTFETNVQITIDLLTDMPYDRTVITESGINTNEHVKLMRRHNVNSFLVGEALMSSKNVGNALRQLFLHPDNTH